MSNPPSPSIPPARPARSPGRVQQAALHFTSRDVLDGRLGERVGPQQALASLDVEQFKEAKRVEQLRLQGETYFIASPTTPKSPQPHSRTPSIPAAAAAAGPISPRGPTPTPGPTIPPPTPPPPVPGPIIDSPASLLADQLASMSLADSNGKRVSGAGLFRFGGESAGNKGKGVAREEVIEVEQSPTPAPRAKSRARTSRDDLALLVVSSSITELAMSIQEAATLIFEIQELRHTTAPAPNPPLSSPSRPRSPSHRRPSMTSNAPSEFSMSSAAVSTAESAAEDGGETEGKVEADAVSEVDAALMRLGARLDGVAKEFAEVETQILPLFVSLAETNDSAGFLRRKWVETASDWEAIQRDAEILQEELKEDKWLTVFRTVSQQAEDMMTSLEKVLKQSHEFIWDLNRRQAKSGGGGSSNAGMRTPSSSSTNLTAAYFGDPESMQPLLSSFIALHRSLHAKIKYYSPACDRVLKILGKGIADRSTKNGEVLRRFGEMKTRWRNLLERIGRIEGEMRGVEEMLREAAGADQLAAGRQETPPQNGKGSIAPSSNGSIGRMSPLRRLANKVTGNSRRPSPPKSTLSSPSATPTRTAVTRPSAAATVRPSPPRPPRSDKRSISSLGTYQPPLGQQPPSPGHRATQSVNNAFGSQSLSLPQAPPRSARRAPSPSPSKDGTSKPRWNISTRREEKETLRDSQTSRPPLSANTFGYSRSGTPSGRSSSAGYRSSSRMSLGRSVNGAGSMPRPISPAYSNFSDASSQWANARPASPSRIPVPGGSRIPSSSNSISGLSSRYRSTTPFSSLEDPEPTSLLQRTMTPTPSSSSLLNVSPAPTRGSPRSRLPTPSGLSPPRAYSPTPSSVSSAAGGFHYRGGQTPEPNLIAQANRMSNIRLPAAHPPPVPSLPSNVRGSTPKPPLSSSRRPTSSAGSPPSRSTAFGGGSLSPLPPPPSLGSSTSSQAYTPNPHDPLDVQIAATVNSLPLHLPIARLDVPLAKNAPVDGSGVGMSAKYALGPRRVAAMCKLVDKVGPRTAKGTKKVLVRVGAGWMDLEAYGLEMLANSF